MNRKLFLLFLVLCGLVLGLNVITYFIGAHNIISKSYQVDYAEGFIWDLSEDISQGEGLYREIGEVEPFQSISYTPMFFVVSGGLIKFFGSYLAVGRLLSMVSLLVAALFAGLTVWQFSKSKVAGTIAGLLLFTIPIIRFWTILNRVDTLALAFTMIGLFLAVRYISSWKIVFASLFFLLAILTKQSYMIAPLSVGLWLLFKDRKLFFKFTGVFVVLGILALAIGALVTSGAMILDIFFRANSNPWDAEVGVKIVSAILQGMFPILGIVGLYLVLIVFKWVKFNLLSLYLILSFFLAWLAASRIGAYGNSLIEFTAIACIVTGLLIALVLESLNNKGTLVKLLGFLVILAPVLIISQGILNFKDVYSYHESIGPVYAEVEEYIEAVEGPVLSENGVFLLNAGKEVLWEPSMLVASRLAYKDPPIGWDQTEFVNQLHSGYYKMVVLDYDIADFYIPGSWSNIVARLRLTPEMAEPIRDHFELVYHSGPVPQVPQGVWIYEYTE